MHAVLNLLLCIAIALLILAITLTLTDFRGSRKRQREIDEERLLGARAQRHAHEEHAALMTDMRRQSQHLQDELYPYEDGDVLVLGPDVTARPDGTMLSWKGESYVPQAKEGALTC